MPLIPLTYSPGKKIAATFTDQTTGQVWNTSSSALETFTVTNVANYGVVPSEAPASSGRYPATIPTGLPNGTYKVDLYIIVGSSLASGDLNSWIGDTAGYFDGTVFSLRLANLDAAVSSRSTFGGGAVASVNNPVSLDLTQAVPFSNAPQSLGDCLNAARADGFGKWAKVGSVLTLYAADGTTPVRVFNLDDATNPTTRS